MSVRVPSKPRWLPAATLVGLVVALLSPLLTNLVVTRVLGVAPSPELIAIGLVIHWVTFVALLGIVLYWERAPLRSIGWRDPRWSTLLYGIAAGVIIALVSGFLSQALGLRSDKHFLAFLLSQSLVVRVLLVITAGVFEETMYRGYAIERLSGAYGGKYVAAAVSLALFTLAHAWAVGAAALLPILLVGGLVTMLYLWRRDLLLNMLAHTTIDAMGLLVIPALG
jgi:CAAX protease family protein